MKNSTASHDSADRVSRRRSRIEDIVLDVLQRRLAGEKLPDEVVLARHPGLLPELAEELSLAEELRDVEQSESSKLAGPSGTFNGLTVRCPHCREPAQLDAETSLRDVLCGHCGSSEPRRYPS